MKSSEIRSKFLKFFEKHNHKLIKSSSLIPFEDETVLFTSAGVQQFIPYILNKQPNPYKRTISIQKCFRTTDIDLIGDNSHLTFFEMLGNWSFNDYFKEEAIKLAYELLTKEFKLNPERFYITIFKGEKKIPRDEEVRQIWKNYIQENKIYEFDKENFWGPITNIGPCGPSSEIHYDLTQVPCEKKEKCIPNCSCNRFIEIWNLVFMQYNKTLKGEYELLSNKVIDTGMGLERISLVLQNTSSLYETDLFISLIQEIQKNITHNYSQNKKSFRIIADHLKASCFLIADGLEPSKDGRGYVLRRLIRKTARHAHLLELKKDYVKHLVEKIIDIYKHTYPEIKNKHKIINVIEEENKKFEDILKKGLKKFEEIIKNLKKKEIPVKEVFHLYDTYGFPFDLTKELAHEKGFIVNEDAFNKEFEKHQEVSRANVESKKGGVGSFGIKVVKQHTATHLLQQALIDVLGKHVKQMGSDLTPERLRFDFTHPRPLTKEEKEKVELIVNQKIKESLEVKKEFMPYNEAIKKGALAFFKEKYPETVSVYKVGNYSMELCGGPHVKNTSEIKSFKIIKEESIGQGIRRIKAVVG